MPDFSGVITITLDQLEIAPSA